MQRHGMQHMFCFFLHFLSMKLATASSFPVYKTSNRKSTQSWCSLLLSFRKMWSSIFQLL
uniref:Uncharacterized protein n=1 Tax=Arundo donax TaxID=35708 RepID=A0A0A9TDB0_ARUDO